MFSGQSPKEALLHIRVLFPTHICKSEGGTRTSTGHMLGGMEQRRSNSSRVKYVHGAGGLFGRFALGWKTVSNLVILSSQTSRKCTRTTLQTLWLLSIQRGILLNPFAMCFHSGKASIFYKHMQYTYVSLWTSMPLGL